MPGTNIKSVSAHLQTIECPDTLRVLPGWLIWRYEQVGDGVKPRKVPYYAGGGKRYGEQGSVHDRSRLTTFEAARAAAARKGFDGVGLALLPEFGVAALDFDDCVGEKGIHPEVERLVSGTYAEFSPSGKGVRAFVLGDLGNRKSNKPGLAFGFETFTSKGYVTFTGNRLDLTDLLGCENAIAQASEEVKSFCQARFKRELPQDEDPFAEIDEATLGLSLGQIEEALEVLPIDLHYDDWLAVGMAIHHETYGEGFEVWEAWSQKSAKYSTREYNEERWHSFGRNGEKPVTARSLLKLAKEHGLVINPQLATADEFEDLSQAGANQQDKSQEKRNRFEVVPAGEFSRGQPPSWLIKGMLPKAELCVTYGEPGSGKTFATLDVAMAIARGIDWRGLRVKQGRVVYVVAEGAGGFRNRLKAYAQHHDLDLNKIPFGVVHAAPNFLQKTDVKDLAKAILDQGPAALIVVDTLAQVTAGSNENSGEDMGLAIAHCKGLHKATGALVNLIHHSGKDSSKGARGWSGLRGAADTEIEVIRSKIGRSLRIAKQKDGDDFGEWGFALESVMVGMDEDGESIDSCVVVESEVPQVNRVASRRKFGEWEALAAEVIGEFALAQTTGIELEAVLDEMVRRRDAPEKGKRDTRRQHAKRAVTGLCEGDDALYAWEDGCITVL